MHSSHVMNKVKEYESFCRNPNFLDSIMAKKVFTLYFILNNENIEKYTQNKRYVSLVPESNIIIALIGLEKDGLIKCEDSQGDSCLEYITELSGIRITVNIDEDTARELNEFLVAYPEKFLPYLKKRREDENQARLLRIRESKEKRSELQQTVDELGGLVFDGLYQGGRRVMARLEPNGRKWLLSDDEPGIISAIGKNRLNKSMNRVDLLKKYGLHEAKEIAPVRFNIDDSGRLEIEREDLWGEKATPFVDRRNLLQRLKDDWNWNDTLPVLLMPHMSVIFFITKNISSRATKILFFSICIVLVALGSTYGRNLHLTYIEQIWFALLVLYFLIPVIILGAIALLSDDD